MTKTATKTASKASDELRPTSSGRKHPGDEWLRIMRRNGWNIAETARQMDAPFSGVYRIVKGGAVPTARMTIRFARATGTDPKRLWSQVAAFELAEALADEG